MLLQRLIALVGFVVLLPVMTITAVAVLLTLGRPVFFIQERSGRLQQNFKLIKFRTMRNNRDAKGELLPDEARTSAFGAFLRKTRLDELPGFINVMKGDMALVGPRPLLPETVSAMGHDGAIRASVRPGMTGWAQVNGNTLLSNDEKCACDVWYVENRNWKLDTQILFRTLHVVLFGEKRSS
ncbi:lipopolysaccharide/colanic/teichoic acid biosynthesis glycosyltransferase [Altererythrobacter atlanticus]|uniref:Sugar transferase EpsL n=1 Tax=Croceibacterium atlanticum TaxID=1267766 RepID=A0A0F7KTC8_9SPHN|nr:sugar transferase [Croceibacterium atlanticum]AKH42859.1 putative sugar transferase EpsL [Croceibacterium atlanticum]MBB5731639.1 lipopolysaccharide/colanic/teichoic acid biosynthesis glycosyltransferase [Croceibacterium atlanticum]